MHENWENPVCMCMYVCVYIKVRGAKMGSIQDGYKVAKSRKKKFEHHKLKQDSSVKLFSQGKDLEWVFFFIKIDASAVD